jgi:hypothetical protein
MITTNLLILSSASWMRVSAKSLTVPGYMASGDVPDTGKEWMSLYPGMEFQASAEVDSNSNPAVKIALDRLLKGSASEYEKQFIDGTETYYNDYSQAWRLLGFFIDCNAPRNNYKECGEDQQNDQDQDSGDEPACQRYLMWAAYIDLNYSGGGIGEYQFYDRVNSKWDSSSCKAKDGRCAKMDCHLKGTSFTLLGFFKEPNYHEWMEQLFKHAGVCIWSDEEYSYMQTDRHLWPCDCTSTDQLDEKGNILYYETKPMVEGRIGLGLYTDSRCSMDYTGKMSVEDVLGEYASSSENDSEWGTVYSLEEDLTKWNNAFDAFKVCQPCKAYDLGFNSDLKEGREGGGEDEDGQSFDCVDDAGYTDVNQCMKFRTKTEMIPADFRDITIAHQQGTIVQVEVLGVTYGYGGYRGSSAGLTTEFSMASQPINSTTSRGFLIASVMFFLLGVALYRMTKRNSSQSSKMEVPLVPSEGIMS